jgi:hypothetical protein
LLTINQFYASPKARASGLFRHSADSFLNFQATICF